MEDICPTCSGRDGEIQDDRSDEDGDRSLAIVLAVWLTVGLTLGVVMGRRGHASFQWLFVGAALGPLALPLAWASVRDEQHRTRELTEGVPSGGAVDVLVGIDGSPESEVALRSAVLLFGTRIGRLTLARVVDFDGSDVPVLIV